MRGWGVALFFLLSFAVLSIIAIRQKPDNTLKLVACDVGQGDAVLVIHGSTQILFDGGPDDSVIKCLSRHLPFWDREIEMVVLSHPQKDHYGGLIDVFRRYRVGTFIATALESGNEEYQVLKEMVGGGGTSIVNPNSAQDIRLGMIYLDVIHPSERFYLSENIQDPYPAVLGAYTTNEDPNSFSVVMELKYGDFEALMTGDIGPSVINTILTEGEIDDVEYIKVPHHGSKNGLTMELLEKSSPEIAVISSGKNQWGHPHKEVIEMLEDKDIGVLRTDQLGDVVIETDGTTWWVD